MVTDQDVLKEEGAVLLCRVEGQTREHHVDARVAAKEPRCPLFRHAVKAPALPVQEHHKDQVGDKEHQVDKGGVDHGEHRSLGKGRVGADQKDQREHAQKEAGGDAKGEVGACKVCRQPGIVPDTGKIPAFGKSEEPEKRIPDVVHGSAAPVCEKGGACAATPFVNR